MPAKNVSTSPTKVLSICSAKIGRVNEIITLRTGSVTIRFRSRWTGIALLAAIGRLVLGVRKPDDVLQLSCLKA
ncbi:MAG: hypothetical protein DHS20C16_15780 [Phycisphaerae bacterium]|nr:MAG: hypothetical protein DHS20C16_15780 [Phycisphaerae bacterium]